jgi:hypothetical protein
MRSIIAALTAVLALSLLGGCSSLTATSPVPAAPKAATSLVASLTPRPGVRYYQPGVHAAGETSVGVGILRYHSISAARGEWLLTSYQGNALLAADVRPLAVLAIEPRFEVGLHRLDGQYITVEGPVVSARNGVPRIGATALCQVSDMFPRDTNVISKPGFYNHPMGMNLVIGWMGETTSGVTTLYDRSPDSTQAPRAIARVIGAQRPDLRDRVMDADVFVIRNGPVPLVEVIGGSAYEPYFRMTEVGSSPEWTRMERAGIKDLPRGRVRVVGTYMSREIGSRDATRPGIAVGDLAGGALYPAAPGYGAFVYLDDPNGLVPKTTDAESSYVGAEGKLTKTGGGFRLAVDRAQTSPFPRRANPDGNHPANIAIPGDVPFQRRGSVP